MVNLGVSYQNNTSDIYQLVKNSIEASVKTYFDTNTTSLAQSYTTTVQSQSTSQVLTVNLVITNSKVGTLDANTSQVASGTQMTILNQDCAVQIAQTSNVQQVLQDALQQLAQSLISDMQKSLISTNDPTTIPAAPYDFAAAATTIARDLSLSLNVGIGINDTSVSSNTINSQIDSKLSNISSILQSKLQYQISNAQNQLMSQAQTFSLIITSSTVDKINVNLNQNITTLQMIQLQQTMTETLTNYLTSVFNQQLTAGQTAIASTSVSQSQKFETNMLATLMAGLVMAVFVIVAIVIASRKKKDDKEEKEKQQREKSEFAKIEKQSDAKQKGGWF